MSLHVAAQHLKSRGRGPDTELVHMSKNELKGLQALALANGGSLTINPDTGLVEAGFLEQILPMAAGAALTYFSGGALAPWASALIVGGGYGAATGSVEKGLMAGLGAYGGAGLTSSLASAGSQAAAEQAGTAATEGFKQTTEQAVTAGLNQPTSANFIPTETGGFNPTTGQERTRQTLTDQAAQNYINPQNFPGLTPTQIQASQAGLPDAIRQGAAPEQYMRGLGQASSIQGTGYGTQVAQGVPQIGSVLAENPGAALSVAAPLLMQDQTSVGPAGYQEDEYDRRLKGFKLSSNYRAAEPVQPNPYYQAQYAAGGVAQINGPVERMSANALGGDANMYPQSQQQRTYFATPTQMPASAEVTRNNQYSGVTMASGGVTGYASRGRVNVAQNYLDNQEQQNTVLPESVGVPRTGIYRDTDVDTARKDALTATLVRLNKTRKGAGMKSIGLPKTAIKGLGQPEVEEAAAGGTMRYNLGGYSDGGRMLKGPGDGMSDSIPASIAGKQPARLADGEFVVPADVVSHLGNGSTDAGAKKLYSMMDKIRKPRTGKKKQAPAVKAHKFMPA